jgi:hypothetical protein
VIAHRAAAPGDRNFIISAWVASYRDADSAGMVAASRWHAVMGAEVADVLTLPDVTATVSYETENPDPQSNAYGFIVADVTERPPLVYYVFVKTAYRRSGIARGLFAAIGVDPRLPFHHVCSTAWVDRLQRKVPMARWVPRLGRFPKHERRGRP